MPFTTCSVERVGGNHNANMEMLFGPLPGWLVVPTSGMDTEAHVYLERKVSCNGKSFPVFFSVV